MSKTKKIKARRMWVNGLDLEISCPRLTATRKRDYREHRMTTMPVAIIDVSDPDTLVAQAAQALGCYVGVGKQARAVLESLGIIPPAKKPARPQHPVEFENADLGEEG